MVSTVQKVESLALSGTDSVTVAVPNAAQSVAIGLAVKYTAVAATTGVQAAFQVSADGSTFVNAAEANLTVAPAAGVVGFGERLVRIEGPLKLNNQPIVAVKVNLTNLDATNAAVVAITSETSQVI